MFDKIGIGICSNTLSDYRGQRMLFSEVCNEYTYGARGTCTSCNFYNPFAGICSNKLSKHRGKYIPPSECCDEYTALEDDYEDEPKPKQTNP